jgi:hypothetical protein
VCANFRKVTRFRNHHRIQYRNWTSFTSRAVPWALRWALLEIFHCGDHRHLSDYGEAFADIANEAGAVPELVRRAAIIADAETPTGQRSSFALAFRSGLKPELHAAFATLLAGLPAAKTPAPVIRRATDDNDDTDHGLFYPGVFGRQKTMLTRTR